MEAFIIHLERATERRENVKRLATQIMAETKLTVNVVAAVDGQAISDDLISQTYVRKLYTPAYPFKLSRGEIACFLSHRKCWQMIVDQDLDAALILEDDVQPNSLLKSAFPLAASNLLGGDYIRFAKNLFETEATRIGEDGNVKLFKPRQIGLGMLAQIVTRDAAAVLLSATEKFDRPVDTLLQMNWLTGVRPITITPPVFHEQSATMGGTTIQRARRFGDKILAEILRPIYRFRISLYARQNSSMRRGVTRKFES